MDIPLAIVNLLARLWIILTIKIPKERLPLLDKLQTVVVTYLELPSLGFRFILSSSTLL